MHRRFRVLTLSLAAFGATLAAAPPALAQAADEPLARFEDAICPGIVGLKREAAEQMVDRIRANVEALGRRVAPEGDCQANVLVAFLDDGGKFIEDLEDKKSWLFAEMGRDEADALLADPGPVRAMLRVRTRTRDGLPIPRRENLVDLPQAHMAMAHSKIYTATRKDILSALVLFDRSAVRGMNVAQLADYATFRALAQTLPQVVELRPDSILALFEGGGERPAGLTDFDRAYLRGLYEGLPNLPGPARLARIEQETGRNIFAE